MKKFWLSVLCLLFIVAPVKADDFSDLVVKDAPMAFCIYPQAFFQSELGKLALAKIETAESFGEIAEFQKQSGINIATDISRAVFVIIDLEKHAGTGDGYVIIEGKFNAKKVEDALTSAAKIKKVKNYKAETVNGLRKLSWVDENGKEVKMIFAAAGKIVVSDDDAILETGLAVATGKAENAKNNQLFRQPKATNGTTFGEGAGIVPEGQKQDNPQMKQVDSFVFNLVGLSTGNSSLTININTPTADTAQQLSQQLMGMKMIFSATLPEVLEKVNIAAKEKDVVLSLELSKQEIEKVAETIKSNQDQSDNEEDEDEDE